MRLLDLPDDVQQLIAAGTLTENHGRALVRFKEHPRFVSWYAAVVAQHGIAARQIEKHLIFPSDFYLETSRAQEEGIYASWRWGEYDEEAARKAHPDAFVKVEHHGPICLDVDLHLRLKQEKRESAAAARQAVVSQMKAAAAPSPQEPGDVGADAAPAALPNLSDLPYDSYAIIGNSPPTGCTNQCPCRGAARQFSGRSESICL